MISLECLLQCDITTGIIQGCLTAVGYFAVSTFEILHVIDNTMMIPGAMKAVWEQQQQQQLINKLMDNELGNHYIRKLVNKIEND